MRQGTVAAGSRFGSRLGVLVAVSAAAIGVIYGYDTGVVAGRDRADSPGHAA